MRRVVVLRPEPGASETVARARRLGLEAVAIPLFAIEPIDWTAPDIAGFDGLLLTSANTLRHGGEQLAQVRGLPVYAVGETTADAARAAGFVVVATGDGGVGRLLVSIEPGLKLLHLCSEDRVDARSGEAVAPIAVYRARPIENLDLGPTQGSVVLIHSPRAGRRFAQVVAVRARIAVATISSAAADAIGLGWEVIVSAERPNDEALLALAASLCNKPPPE